jgi:hypothetical protein
VNYPCPCCGYLVFREEPGSEEICPVCWWQDDISSLIHAEEASGPNKVSLVEAQRNFQQIGVAERRLVLHIKANARDHYKKDPQWRPVDLRVDSFPVIGTPTERLPDPPDISGLYYWRHPTHAH